MVDERKRIARRIEQGENSNGLRERQTSLERGLSSLRAEVEELDQQARRQWVLALADDPFNTIADDVALRGGPYVVRPGRREPLPSPSAAQSAAMRAINHHSREDVLATRDADRLADLVAKDLEGLDAGYSPPAPPRRARRVDSRAHDCCDSPPGGRALTSCARPDARRRPVA
jgi:hypothetical protein